MFHRLANEASGEALFLAGERVNPGVYRQVENGREVVLDEEDFLPASLDGHVACYTRINRRWADIAPRYSARV